MKEIKYRPKEKQHAGSEGQLCQEEEQEGENLLQLLESCRLRLFSNGLQVGLHTASPSQKTSQVGGRLRDKTARFISLHSDLNSPFWGETLRAYALSEQDALGHKSLCTNSSLQQGGEEREMQIHNVVGDIQPFSPDVIHHLFQAGDHFQMEDDYDNLRGDSSAFESLRKLFSQQALPLFAETVGHKEPSFSPDCGFSLLSKQDTCGYTKALKGDEGVLVNSLYGDAGELLCNEEFWLEFLSEDNSQVQ